MKSDQSSMKYLGLGVELGIVMTLPVYLGNLADVEWNCSPYGLSFGLAVGIGGLVKSVRRVMRDYQTTLNAMQRPPEQTSDDGAEKDQNG